jgi:hypothetical protein
MNYSSRSLWWIPSLSYQDSLIHRGVHSMLFWTVHSVVGYVGQAGTVTIALECSRHTMKTDWWKMHGLSRLWLMQLCKYWASLWLMQLCHKTLASLWLMQRCHKIWLSLWLTQLCHDTWPSFWLMQSYKILSCIGWATTSNPRHCRSGILGLGMDPALRGAAHTAQSGIDFPLILLTYWGWLQRTVKGISLSKELEKSGSLSMAPWVWWKGGKAPYKSIKWLIYTDGAMGLARPTVGILRYAVVCYGIYVLCYIKHEMIPLVV